MLSPLPFVMVNDCISRKIHGRLLQERSYANDLLLVTVGEDRPRLKLSCSDPALDISMEVHNETEVMFG